MKNKFNVKRLNIRKILSALIVSTSLFFTGCYGLINDVKENQVRLQSIMQAHAQQIAKDAARIEKVNTDVNDIQQKQTALQQQMTTVQNDAQLLREQMIIVLKQLKDQLTQLSSQISATGMVRK